MEDRRVLSITPPILLADSTLVIRGDALDDTVVVSEDAGNGTIVVQQYELDRRVTTSFPRSSVTSLQFFGQEGNDRLTNQTDIPAYAEGGEGSDILTGGSGADFLDGGEGNDRLVGGSGDDVLFGDDGDDALLGKAGADRLEGGHGNDSLYGGDGNDRGLGGDGNDLLDGAAGDDYLNGGSGDDRLNGGADDDELYGAAGNDRLVGRLGDDRLDGGQGEDALLGDGGNDLLNGGPDDDLLYGGDGSDRLHGGEGGDRLEGESGADYLNGDAGSDLLFGGDGDDFLNGATGNDRLLGDAGNDTLLGGDGEDSLFGDIGNDRLDGGSDNDYLYGGDGSDLLYGKNGSDRLAGDSGDDYLNGGGGDDFLSGGGDDDFLNGSAGNDRLSGQAGSDELLGGEGEDVLFGGAGVDRLDGGRDDDTLYGDEGRDFLFGRSGADRLEGNDGNDYLNGGSEGDFLLGGEGDDYLTGDAGADRLEAGAGDDFLLGGDGDDALLGDSGADQLLGNRGEDLLYGGDGNDRISGGDGDDRAFGEAGDDRLDGGVGVDSLAGGTGDDPLVGGDGNDRLEGESGADILLGGDGDDALIGGEGADLAIGGLGTDSLLGYEGGDLLIGASTVYDQHDAALREALATWNSELDYDQRRQALTGHGAAVRFIPNTTVFADLVSDRVEGGSGQDWYIQSATNGIYNPLGVPMPHHDGGHGHHQPMLLLDRPPVVEGFALIDSIDRLIGVEYGETIDSLLAHSHHSPRRGEHFRLFQLVRYADVTHTAIASGDWSDPATWASGTVPTSGARVLIPFGATVTVDREFSQELRTIRVDGTLSFATDTNTELRVDTVVVTVSGAFKMGDAANPIERGVTATLHITDDGPIDRVADPFLLGRGLVTHGSVRLHGDAVTPFTTAVGGLEVNDSVIRLSEAPVGWAVGDRIAIAGTAFGGGEDEVRVIRGINGATITIDPLDYDHTPLEAGLGVHLANTTRNVVIESAATESQRRGHVMFMHNRDVQVSYAAFNGLGRTDKSVDLTDQEVDSEWRLVGDTGANPRGRYAVHFHLNGVRADSPPATVHGSVVNGGPSWGFVNHSSYVDFTGNVSYAANGAAFVAEAGDEIGLFDSNLAVNTTGTTEDVDARVRIQDFGFNGDGFWLQSPGVSVTNNVAAGSAGSAFFYYTRGLRTGGSQTEFLAENLDDPSLAGGRETIPVIHTPIKRFEGNLGYASRAGLNVRYNLRNAPHDGQSLVSDSTFWNNRIGVDIPYARNTVLRDLVVLTEPSDRAVNGIDNNSETRDITYQDLRIEGYKRAIVAPVLGDNRIEGGRYLSSLANILVNPVATDGTRLVVSGSPQFGGVDGASVVDVAMNFTTSNAARNPSQVFFASEVRLDYGPFSNQRLYFRQQEASAIPFPAPLDGLPSQYVGLTQAQLFEQFGVAVGGEIAPDDTSLNPRVLGLVGSRNLA